MGTIVFFTGSEADQTLARSLSVLFVSKLKQRYDMVPIEHFDEYLGKAGSLPILACFVGVDKAPLRRMLDQWWVPWLFFGPSYHARGKAGHYRAAVCDVHPLHWLGGPGLFLKDPSESLSMWTNPPSKSSPILVCGASPTFHKFMGLSEPFFWLHSIVSAIRQFSNRQIVYRAKPGHESNFGPVLHELGVRPSSNADLLSDMQEAHCMVVHSSNTCLDAYKYGLPCVVFGHGVTKPISTPLPLLESFPLFPAGPYKRFCQRLNWCDVKVNDDGDLSMGDYYITQLLRTHPRTHFLLES